MSSREPRLSSRSMLRRSSVANGRSDGSAIVASTILSHKIYDATLVTGVPHLQKGRNHPGGRRREQLVGRGRGGDFRQVGERCDTAVQRDDAVDSQVALRDVLQEVGGVR